MHGIFCFHIFIIIVGVGRQEKDILLSYFFCVCCTSYNLLFICIFILFISSEQKFRLKCCQLSVIPDFVCLLALIFHYGKYLHYLFCLLPLVVLCSD